MVHPLYERLLERFCNENGLDYARIVEMTRGRRHAPPGIVDLLYRTLGVPRDVWIPSARGRVSEERPLVSPARPRYVDGVTAVAAKRKNVLRENARRRRRYGTAVHAVLDRLDWTIEEFAERISEEMGKPVSRASVQFWATGTRQVGPRGKSKAFAVQAPQPVRLAAEKVTAREAMKRRLGEAAILNRAAWPNVERETA